MHKIYIVIILFSSISACVSYPTKNEIESATISRGNSPDADFIAITTYIENNARYLVGSKLDCYCEGPVWAVDIHSKYYGNLWNCGAYYKTYAGNAMFSRLNLIVNGGVVVFDVNKAYKYESIQKSNGYSCRGSKIATE